MSHEPRDPINELAHRAYCAAVSTRGHNPESWTALGSRRRRSWRAAVRAVLDFVNATASVSGAELTAEDDKMPKVDQPRSSEVRKPCDWHRRDVRCDDCRDPPRTDNPRPCAGGCGDPAFQNSTSCGRRACYEVIMTRAMTPLTDSPWPGPRVHWCERHARPDGDTSCLMCACEEMSAALGQIDALVDPAASNDGGPNSTTTYDVEASPKGVVARVKAEKSRTDSAKQTDYDPRKQAHDLCDLWGLGEEEKDVLNDLLVEAWKAGRACSETAPPRADEPRPGGGSRYTHPGPDTETIAVVRAEERERCAKALEAEMNQTGGTVGELAIYAVCAETIRQLAGEEQN